MADLYRLTDINLGIVFFQHIADNSCHLKFGNDGKNRAAGTGHLVAHGTVLMEQGLDVVQLQMLVGNDRIENVAQIVGYLQQVPGQQIVQLTGFQPGFFQARSMIFLGVSSGSISSVASVR